jgi:hypothetical protein
MDIQMLPTVEGARFVLPNERWFEAPAVRTARFHSVYIDISVALQQTLRVLAPELCFRDLRRLENIDYGYPMLAYQASGPFRSRTVIELASYDVLDPNAMELFYDRVLRALPKLLGSTRDRLVAAGLHEIAKAYQPAEVKTIFRRIVHQRQIQKPLRQLLTGEAALVNALVFFAGTQSAPSKQRARIAALVTKKWKQVLSHLYHDVDFSEIGPVLFEAATRALISALDRKKCVLQLVA